MSVEEIARNYYKNNGFPEGIHCEGSVMSAAFCILFWDIIYDYYVPATFISEVQSAPLDYKTEYFYTNRKRVIDRRLKEIEEWSNEKFHDLVTDCFSKHSHQSSLYRIEVVDDPKILLKMLDCVDRKVLSKIMERFARNPKHYHSGMPDLMVWNSEEKKVFFYSYLQGTS